MDRRRTLLMHAWLQLVLWVAIALVANHLSSSLFFRADVTRDQRYTLSEVSRQTVASLDKPLVVRVFYSKDLGPPYNNHRQDLLDKLEELAAVSSGRIQIEVADPDTDKDDAEEARRYGIRPIPYRFKQGSRFEAREIYMGVSLLYGERALPVDLLTATETFEYQLVKGLRALTRPPEERKVVGYSTGHGEIDLMGFPEESPVGQLVIDVATTHQLKAVELGGEDDPLADIDVLLVNGPEIPLSPRAQYQIDQFLMAGKPVAFFMRGIRPDFRSMRVQVVRHDLYALLGHYGLQLNRDVILDRDHNEQFEVPIMREGRMRRVQVDYPLIPVTTDLNKAHPVTAGIDAAVLPFVSSITVPEELPRGVTADVLIRSMPESAKLEGLIYVSPEVFDNKAPGEEPGAWPAVVALSGRFGSFYAEKPIPAPQGRSPDDPTWDPDPASKIVDSAPTRLLLAGSADMLANNPTLVANAIDWLAEDTDLLQIRTELAQDATFEAPDGSTLQLTRAGLIGGPLVVLYGVGLVVFVVGRRRR